MTAARRWLPLVPVGVLCASLAAVTLVPGRSQRADRATGVIIALSAAAILAAAALEAFTHALTRTF